jgi:hypothetical protein
VFTNGLLVVLSVCLTILAVEGASRLYLHFNPAFFGIGDEYRFRLQQPAPYQGAPYFSPAFIEESFMHGKPWLLLEGTNIPVPTDFAGKYFTVVDRRRVTTDQPADYEHTIYVFGGSTVYCSEVSDAYTLTSYLQRLVNQRFGSRYRVENYGSTGLNVQQQVEYLRRVQLTEGGIVIFYDGVNEMTTSIYFNDPTGSIVSSQQTIYNEQFTPIERLAYQIFTAYGNRSAFVFLFFQPKQIDRDLNLTNLNERLSAMKQVMQSGVRDAAAYSAAGGAQFYHFLQPHLYSRANPPAYEVRLQQQMDLMWYDFDQVFPIGTPVLQAAQAELAAEGIAGADLTATFDPLDAPLYLDYVHVNHVANEHLAQRIFEVIFGTSTE